MYFHSGRSALTILFYTEVSTIASQELLINEEIRDREVRLIDEKGNQQGVVALDVALRMAEEADLDLVKIAPQAVPPVCKIMDYGKYRFEQTKREKEQKKNQKVIEIKEIRLSATIDQHDMEVKAKACTKFLSDGNKVKVSIRFKGRQARHGDIGLDVMNAFFEMVKDSAAIGPPCKAGGTQYVHDTCTKSKLNYFSKRRKYPMPKIKTHRGAAKRFSLTKNGKIKRGKAYKSHILTKKTTKRLRGLRKPAILPSAKPRRFASSFRISKEEDQQWQGLRGR